MHDTIFFRNVNLGMFYFQYPPFSMNEKETQLLLAGGRSPYHRAHLYDQLRPGHIHI